MALIPGDITAASGLAKRIFDNFVANASACGFGASLTGAAADMMRAQAFCIASAIVDEVAANGEAYIGTSLGGLQLGTSPPSEEKSVPLR